MWSRFMWKMSWSTRTGSTGINVKNPNSGINAVTLDDGRHLLVYNPLTTGENWWEGRNILKVAVSQDGRNWKDVLTLEQHKKGEYSYPAIIQDAEGLVHITYTFDRKTIKHVVVDPEF